MQEYQRRVNGIEAVVTFGVSWWVMPYIRALQLFCFITQLPPDTDKTLNVIKLGVYAKINGVKLYPLRGDGTPTGSNMQNFLKRLRNKK